MYVPTYVCIRMVCIILHGMIHMYVIVTPCSGVLLQACIRMVCIILLQA